MEEKILIKSEPATRSIILPVLLIVLSIILLIISYGGLAIYCIILFLAGLIWMFVLLCGGYSSKCELTVTDKRVYGNIKHLQRVDLPIDSITAVGTSSFKGVEITTASGAIKFKFIKNRDDIHRVISNLLIERQQKKSETSTVINEVKQSNADELKKYRELYDSGVITEAEYNAKKKQLLGL